MIPFGGERRKREFVYFSGIVPEPSSTFASLWSVPRVRSAAKSSRIHRKMRTEKCDDAIVAAKGHALGSVPSSLSSAQRAFTDRYRVMLVASAAKTCETDRLLIPPISVATPQSGHEPR